MLDLLAVALPWFYLGLAIQFVMRLSRSRGAPRAVIVRAVAMAGASGLLVCAILGISRLSGNARVGALGLALLLAGLALKTLKDAETGKVYFLSRVGMRVLTALSQVPVDTRRARGNGARIRGESRKGLRGR